MAAWGIRDSKQISPQKRAELFSLIQNQAVAQAIVAVGEREIEEINILQASLKAMRLCIEKLAVTPDLILIDGPYAIPGLSLRQKPVVKGDSLSLSIAAASILAKVTRDRLMEDYDRQYPKYGFARHKGYPTEDHLRALRIHGACPIHRRTFAGVTQAA